MTALLEISGVKAYYGLVTALHGIDITVGEGEIVAVLGANGAGKTTLMRAVSRTVRTTGTIAYGGIDIGKYSTDRVAKLGVGHVPEGRGTFAELTVDDNLHLGQLARGRRMREAAQSDLDGIRDLFPVLGEMRHRIAGTLSGGQQQILAIARALLGRPRLLMLDEMSLGLAPQVTAEIFGKIVALRTDWNLSILLAEQNVHLSLEVADRAYVLDSGAVVASGSADELSASNAVERAYMGH